MCSNVGFNVKSLNVFIARVWTALKKRKNIIADYIALDINRGNHTGQWVDIATFVHLAKPSSLDIYNK